MRLAQLVEAIPASVSDNRDAKHYVSKVPQSVQRPEQWGDVAIAPATIRIGD
ncbi:MAG TPA: hypothetical protein VMY18_05860 [Acidobacteriota bacterium]|nr:hypothetical protein [Acidobacteriota bacterium]